jgi:hypothetical protein
MTPPVWGSLKGEPHPLSELASLVRYSTGNKWTNCLLASTRLLVREIPDRKATMKLYVIQSGTDFLMNGLNQIKVFTDPELAQHVFENISDPWGREWAVREAGVYEM